jgi:glycosyltransferase involved in cell wall biosynthesis
VPVIVSSNAGTSTIIKDGWNGYVIDNPKDLEKLGELIETIAFNDALKEKIGLNARKTAEEFSWDKVARKVIEVYKKVEGES